MCWCRLGMLSSAETADVVAEELKKHAVGIVVLDPVISISNLLFVLSACTLRCWILNLIYVKGDDIYVRLSTASAECDYPCPQKSTSSNDIAYSQYSRGKIATRECNWIVNR